MGKSRLDYNSLIGQKFGRLTVIKRVEDKIEKNGKNSLSRRPQFLCKCECGNYKIATAHALKTGDVQSCGCLAHDLLIQRNSEGTKYNHYDMESFDYGLCWNEDMTQCFKFDKEDYDLIKDYYWNDHKGYAYGKKHGTQRGEPNIQMSRLVMHALSSDLDVDHIHHDTHDNRKSELRVIPHSLNMKNIKLRKDNTSGIIGSILKH